MRGEEAQETAQGNRCRRVLVTGETLLGRKRKTRRQETVGSVAANPDNLESNKEAGGGAQGTQGLSKLL